jgi:putative ABC transport system permease protein
MEIRPILSALLRNKTAPLLVAIQVAISLAILVNALYVVNLRLAASVRPSGIADEENVFYVSTSPLPKRTHQDILAQQRIDTDALKAIPGVVSVAWTNQMPMSRSGNNSGFSLDRKQQKTSAVLATYYSPDSLVKTLGLKIVDGRDFNDGDIVELDDDQDDGAKKFPKGVIITKPLADFLYPNQGSAVGKSLLYGLGNDAAETRVIGVVERLQTTGASVRPTGEYSVIIPWRTSASYSRFVVRAEPGQRDRVMADAEAALRKVAQVPTVVRGRTVESDRINRYRNEKALASMLIAVCVLLLLVTASGIVGMTTLRVAQRKKLIGVRRALGARKRDILSHFITENVLITSGGVFIGLVLALSLNQLLVSQLELPKLPLAYLAFGSGALWLLGVLAVYGPAWRASGISPAIATRSA